MKKPKDNLSEQLVVRVAPDLKKFYEKAAKAEKRKLSVMLRLVLEDHRPIIEERQQAV